MYECDDKMVSHPAHYQGKNGLEVINVIEAFTADLKGIEATDTGNVLKYMCRWKSKNGLQDLKKALWYLTDLIDHVEKSEMTNIGENIVNSYKDGLKDNIDPVTNIELEVLFDNSQQGCQVLNVLVDLLKTHGVVTIYDYFCVINHETLCVPFDIRSYGWKDFTSARVVPTKSGNFYTILLPTPIKL